MPLSQYHRLNRHCPDCGGPTLFERGDSDSVLVVCANPRCLFALEYRKDDDGDSSTSRKGGRQS